MTNVQTLRLIKCLIIILIEIFNNIEALGPNKMFVLVICVFEYDFVNVML